MLKFNLFKTLFFRFMFRKRSFNDTKIFLNVGISLKIRLLTVPPEGVKSANHPYKLAISYYRAF